MYLIGADLGTTCAKAGAFDEEGQLLSLAVQKYPHPSKIEEADPQEWWGAIAESLRRVARDRGRPAGISIGSQGPSVVALDDAGRPTGPAILWMDLRAGEEAEILSKRMGRTISPAWFVPKVMWLKEHRPGMYRRSRFFIQAMDYAVFRLTGMISTGVASPEIVPWSEDEIAGGGLDGSRFPDHKIMGELIGEVTAKAAQETGIHEGAPVYVGAPDFVESILGTASTEKGMVCDRAGTSEGVDLCWDQKIKDHRLYCRPHPAAPGMWHLGGTIASTGKSLEWIGRILGRTSFEDLLEMAEGAPPGSEGLLFLPHLMGERNALWKGARGGFFGLTHRHREDDLVRAIIEGCAYSIRHLLTVMVEGGARPTEIRVTGSQAKSDLWNQVKADVTGLEVVAPQITEGEVLGAAVIVAFGAGLYPDLQTACRKMVRQGARFHPREETKETYDRLCSLHGKLYPALEETYRELGETFN